MELLIAVLLAALTPGLANRRLEEVYRWKTVRYDTPPGYPEDPQFSPESALYTGMEVTPSWIFLTTPSVSGRPPATLSTIPNREVTVPDAPPLLQAYPSWDWHIQAVQRNITDCQGTMVSTFRVWKDKCNRLWVLDSGVLDSAGDVSFPCRPKILVFDLFTDRLIRLITFPSDVVTQDSLMVNLFVDDHNFVDNTFGDCDSVFVYMSDTTDPGLVVYDSPRNRFWRIEHPSMDSTPQNQDITIDNESFTIMDGILGLVVTGRGSSRSLYYHALAGTVTYRCPTWAIQQGAVRLPISEAFNKSSQALGMTTDLSDGSIVYNPITKNSILSWNPSTRRNRLLAYNEDLVKPVSEFKADSKNNGVIWFVSTRLQRYFSGTVSGKDYNLWLMKLVPNSWWTD